MIEAGWLRGTSTLVMGPSGAGKTLLGLHFLREGIRNGEPGLLVNFQENPTQLGRICRSLSWDEGDIPGCSRLDVLYTSPVELQIDSIVGQIFERIDGSGIRRVVIDALGDLINASRDIIRFRDYAYALTQRFASGGVTAMMTMEAPQPSTLGEVSPMVDNMLLLEMHFGETVERTIRIVKTRGSGHDSRRYPLRITSSGISIDRSSAGARAAP